MPPKKNPKITVTPPSPDLSLAQPQPDLSLACPVPVPVRPRKPSQPSSKEFKRIAPDGYIQQDLVLKELNNSNHSKCIQYLNSKPEKPMLAWIPKRSGDNVFVFSLMMPLNVVCDVDLFLYDDLYDKTPYHILHRPLIMNMIQPRTHENENRLKYMFYIRFGLYIHFFYVVDDYFNLRVYDEDKHLKPRVKSNLSCKASKGYASSYIGVQVSNLYTLEVLRTVFFPLFI